MDDLHVVGEGDIGGNQLEKTERVSVRDQQYTLCFGEPFPQFFQGSMEPL